MKKIIKKIFEEFWPLTLYFPKQACAIMHKSAHLFFIVVCLYSAGLAFSVLSSGLAFNVLLLLLVLVKCLFVREKNFLICLAVVFVCLHSAQDSCRVFAISYIVIVITTDGFGLYLFT